MKIQKKKLVSIVVTCLLALTMVFTTPMSTSMAKTKTTLSSSEMTIGIGSYGDEYGYYHKTKAKYQILLNDTLKGAKYTFTSSNNKIVTVTSNTKSANRC